MSIDDVHSDDLLSSQRMAIEKWDDLIFVKIPIFTYRTHIYPYAGSETLESRPFAYGLVGQLFFYPLQIALGLEFGEADLFCCFRLINGFSCRCLDVLKHMR